MNVEKRNTGELAPAFNQRIESGFQEVMMTILMAKHIRRLMIIQKLEKVSTQEKVPIHITIPKSLVTTILPKATRASTIIIIQQIAAHLLTKVHTEAGHIRRRYYLGDWKPL